MASRAARSPTHPAVGGLGLLVALATTIPLWFLLHRAAQADAEVWARLWSPRIAQLVLRSVGLSLAVAAATSVLGTALAWYTTHGGLYGRRVFRALLPLPLAIPSYLGAYAWIGAFAPGGLAKVEGTGAYGFLGAFVVLTLLTYPYVYLPVQAALSNVDVSTEEAARSLGAGPWQARWVAYGTAATRSARNGAMVVLLYVLSDFGAVSLLRYDTFTRVIYNQLESTINRSATAALAVVSLAVTAVLVWVFSLRSATPVASDIRRAPSQRQTVAGTVLSAVVVVSALIFPLAVVASWWVATALDTGRIVRLTQNSLSASVWAGLVTALIALPVAYWSARNRSGWAQWAYRVAHLGYGIPGVVIGLALIFGATRAVPALYQTLTLLVFAYAVRFIPQAIAAERSVCAALSPRLLEAGRSLGAGPVQLVLRIVLPLLRPGVASAAIVVFLTSMKELPMTLLLAPLNFSTLATDVWSQASEASFAAAAGPALLLVFVSVLPLAYLRHAMGAR